MVAKYAKFTTVLKVSGHSLTQARRAVFEAIHTTHPVTMSELVAACLPVADRASVYRAVELFEKLGIITRVYVGWKYKLELSDTFSPHHHHLTCTTCSRVVTITETPAIEQAIIHLTKSAGFASASHQLEIRGTCQNCQQ